MFLENLNEDLRKDYLDFQIKACTYTAKYDYWMEQLFERVMRLFVWENTEEVQPKEIEQRLIISGHCGITKIKREQELTAMFGTFYTPTKYYDEWKNYTVRCPIYSGQRTIGKDVTVINNNALRNPVMPLLNHYAQLLAHTEVTYIDMIINARDSIGIPVVTTEKQKQAVRNYQAKRFNGVFGAIADPSAIGINYTNGMAVNSENFKELWATRNNILKDFYTDIGVKAAFEKQSNTVDAEVRSNDTLLLLNLSDMLASREKGCKDVNKMYGRNWSVKLSEELEAVREEFFTEEAPEEVNDENDQ